MFYLLTILIVFIFKWKLDPISFSHIFYLAIVSIAKRNSLWGVLDKNVKLWILSGHGRHYNRKKFTTIRFFVPIFPNYFYSFYSYFFVVYLKFHVFSLAGFCCYLRSIPITFQEFFISNFWSKLFVFIRFDRGEHGKLVFCLVLRTRSQIILYSIEIPSFTTSVCCLQIKSFCNFSFIIIFFI